MNLSLVGSADFCIAQFHYSNRSSTEAIKDTEYYIKS